MSARPALTYSLLIRPGLHLPLAEQRALVGELRAVAATCFEGEAPRYQALSGDPAELARAVIALARDERGALMAFCSCLLLSVDGVGDVFHLGLTCVAPEARSLGLTHTLLSKAATGYLLRHRPFGSVWVSNVACVLSSIGNVALHFDDVHPSPYRPATPSAAQLAVARAISAHHRAAAAIDAEAELDEAAFVFRRSVPGTCFEKSASDDRYHHRDARLNGWYAQRMRFVDGDEVVQVGRMSVLGAVRHALGRTVGLRRRWLDLGALPAPQREPGLALR